MARINLILLALLVACALGLELEVVIVVDRELADPQVAGRD